MTQLPNHPLPATATDPDAAKRDDATTMDAAQVLLLLRRWHQLPDSLVSGTEIVTPDEFVQQYGADPADIATTVEFMEAAGLSVVISEASSRSVVVAGSLAALCNAFGVTAAEATAEKDPELRIPAELRGIVVSAFGLDSVPQMIPMYRTIDGQPQIVYTPPELGRLYDFPAEADGAGQTLVIISVTGGFRQQDMEDYFNQLGLRVPQLDVIGIDGAGNTPGPVDVPPSAADIEALLDVQIAGALAPGARLVDYFAPNTEQGVVDAVRAAIHTINPPTAISISWGSTEKGLTSRFRDALEEFFRDAAALGITVCAATGDAGSGNNEYDGGSHVNYPASSPHVLAVGGTTLFGDPASNTIHSETVWNTGAGRATGGGVSDLFDLPRWQADAGVPPRFGRSESGRGLPDVSANADSLTGYQILMNGQLGFVGGTSAAAPLWAALVCRLSQSLGRPLGLLAPLVYRDLTTGQVTAGFRDIVAGDNGAYAADPGWDPNSGLGSPDGVALLAALRSRILPD